MSEYPATTQTYDSPPPAASPQSASRPLPIGISLLGVWLPRLLVAALFIYTGWGKLKAPANFAKEIRSYEMVSVDVAQAMAIVLPPLEILCGLFFLTGPFRKETRVLLIGMLIAFNIAKAYAGFPEDCGCVPADSPLKFLFAGVNGFVTNCVALGLVFLEMFFSRRRTPQSIN